MWYIYTIKYYSALRKNELLSFATLGMEQECIIMLSEGGQSKQNKYPRISPVCGLEETKQMNFLGGGGERETNHKRPLELENKLRLDGGRWAGDGLLTYDEPWDCK